MSQKVFLIHGWSVSDTTTYQAIHLKLAEYGFDIQNIFLGRYVSLEDKVEIRDIARALHLELEDKLDGDWKTKFHIITHSTGALVTKHWIVNHYKDTFVEKQPLQNVIFLAGPHFGSRLAHHGYSMLAQVAYFGDTGRKVLNSLELGSSFSWESNGDWLDEANWKMKGIRPFNLIGDRVKKDFFKSKIFPAGYEAGSDMVVRVPAGNLNFKRFTLSADTGKLVEAGKIQGVPFAAFSDYIHTGEERGIMNSIKQKATPETHLGLKLILDCLKVKTSVDYDAMRKTLDSVTRETRKKKPAFAQLDFRFRDTDGQPVDDYVFKLGYLYKDKKMPSELVVNTHKNEINPNHFTAFLNMQKLDKDLVYFIEIDSRTGSELFSYTPDPFYIKVDVKKMTHIISENQTTQIDVILSREPNRNLFVFHSGDDHDLHVKWNRAGEIVKTKLPTK